MPYLIDGHNLIPKIPGLSLRIIDDEERLMEFLQAFGSARRQRMEVFFDNAPPGHARQQKRGWVTAHFVRSGQTADDAILRRLRQLGKDASNWTVVSSDHQVQHGARQLRATAVSSENFYRFVEYSMNEPPASESQPSLSPDEVEEWLRMFSSGHQGKGND